jgi:hypothetical protein
MLWGLRPAVGAASLRYATRSVPLLRPEDGFHHLEDSGASLGPSSSRSLAAILGIRAPPKFLGGWLHIASPKHQEISGERKILE